MSLDFIETDLDHLDDTPPEAWAEEVAIVCDLCGDLVADRPEYDLRPLCQPCLDSGLCTSCWGHGHYSVVVSLDPYRYDCEDVECDACLGHGVRGRS